ncbi:MAG: hypothetical protein ABIG96_01390 [Candidatus Micrarchaeota archaeon]
MKIVSGLVSIITGIAIFGLFAMWFWPVVDVVVFHNSPICYTTACDGDVCRNIDPRPCSSYGIEYFLKTPALLVYASSLGLALFFVLMGLNLILSKSPNFEFVLGRYAIFYATIGFLATSILALYYLVYFTGGNGYLYGLQEILIFGVSCSLFIKFNKFRKTVQKGEHLKVTVSAINEK